MSSWNIGGEAASAALIIWNSRHRNRARRRTAASVIRRLRLLRGAALFAREYDAEAMV